ncbi:hypothetical protein Glove_5g26 [Diversispora epigaea]|uniref:BACK domain-containing protein n=1 Tax=Diversispora epigaea TaxID=1348612 RepID=A0A397JRZ9_9GLOM|nr:hypothetical protein Glove_5g26 [Diversispora epigaea]
MAFKFFEKLSQDFSELLNDKEEYNVIIEFGQEQREKKLLCALHLTLIKNYQIPYIYGGIVNTENMDNRTIYDLMILANELEFEEVSEKLENLLIESKDSWLRTHFIFVYHSIFKHSKFKNLEKFCNGIVVKHPSIIFESAEFSSFHESALTSILKHDDLQMKESEIWNYVIKWLTAQNPTLPAKLEEWSDENFMTLKITLQQCLSLIRYFHIPNSDVVYKIKPYKKILDKQLWNDLKLHLMLPNQPVESTILPPRILKQELPVRMVELFSIIIIEENASMISSWIDKKITSYSSRNNPHELINSSRK